MASLTNGDEAFRFNNDVFQMLFNGASSGNLVTTQVFRDPSAWYHFVVAVDTSQATASNRVKIYVNGLQITSFSTSTYPSQNYNTSINAAGTNFLGYNTSEDFDGYMAEVNFVDGQQLTPFAFGNFNPTTGVWGANKYIGTYGNNGFYLPFTDTSGLTLLSNTGLGRDFSGNGNFWATTNISLATATTITSFTSTGTTSWTAPAGVTSVNYLVVAGGGAGGNHNGGGGGGGGVLQGNVPVVPGQSYTVTVGAGGSAQSDPSNGGNGGNSQFGNNIIALGGGGGAGQLTASGLPNGNSGGSGGGGGGGENSIVVGSSGGAGTTGQGFAGGGPGLEVAGVYTQRAGGGGGGASQAGVGPVNAYSGGTGGNGVVSYISGTGAYYGGGGGGGSQWDQGTAVVGAGGLGGGGSGAAVSNASTSVTYVASTAGTTNTGGGGGAQGRSANSSASAGGSGIVILQYTTSGSSTTYDSMLDSPTLANGSTANYATLNPLQRVLISGSTYTLINGNLDWTSTGAALAFYSTIGMTSGKYYAEFTATTPNMIAGVWGNGNAGMSLSAYPTYYWDIGAYGAPLAVEKTSGTVTGPSGAININDIYGIAVDLDNANIYFYRNGVLNATVTGMVWVGPLYFIMGTWTSGANSSGSVNFGQRPFVYSLPSGFDTLNTYNLASPTIPAGNVAVNAITFSGGSSTPPGLGQLPKRTALTLAPVNSLRLRSGNSGYLNRTPFTASNTNTWTFSAWVKRGTISSSASYALLTAGYPTAPWLYVGFQNDNMYLSYTAGVNTSGQILSNAVLRDVSQWYHLVWAIDTTQAVTSNRVQFYVNGQQVTSFIQASYPSQYQSLFANNTVGHQIGGYTGQFYDGYISEVNFVDGQQLLPSAFGTTNTDGQWVPIPYIGTYGINGYRLPFTGNVTSSYAGSFDGSTTYITNNSADPNLNLSQNNFTVEGWYYSTNVNSNNARYMVFQPGQALGADISNSNNTVTVSGTPAWSQFSPYGASTQGGSLYFNGTNTSLQSNSSTGNFLFGNGNFTVEAWIYPLNITAYQYLASVWGVIGGPGDNAQSCWQIRINTSGNLEAILNNGSANTTLTGSTVLTLRQWQHVALVRYNNVITLFVNGVNVGSTAYTSTLNNVPTTQFVIGQQLPSSYYFNGYMTNLRIVNGTALYTTPWFVPPTAALLIVNSTQTVLLMNVGSAGAYIADSSNYAQSLTINGSLVFDPSSPYSPVNFGGSAYLDGSSANFNVTTVSAFQLATANTPFTIECWAYPVSTPSGSALIAAAWPSSGNIPFTIAFLNNLAAGVSGSNLSAGWYNGSAWQTVIQTTTNLTLRTWSHVALSYDGTTARLFLNGSQIGSATGAWTTAAIQNTLYVGRRWDSNASPFFNGYITNVRFVNGISMYGSNFTPQTNAALTAVPNTVLLMNTTSNGNTWGLIPSASTNFALNLFGGSPFAFNTTTVNSSMKLNVWQHIALVRQGQVTTLYVDGVASASTVYPWWPNSPTQYFVGGITGTFAAYFTGQISNFRIVLGYAVYTSNFIPQTSPLTSIPGTYALTLNALGLQQLYTINTAGGVYNSGTNSYSFTFVPPAGVTSVSVVAVGGGGGGSLTWSGGGGGGGGLGWRNSISVVPGQSYTVVVGAGGIAQGNATSAAAAGGTSYFISTATVAGYGGGQGGSHSTSAGGGYGGGWVGDGGGRGGDGAYNGAWNYAGGGAGGYTGNGGDAANSQSNGTAAPAGGGGSAGGYYSSTYGQPGGGGVGIFGQGASGAATGNGYSGGNGGSGGGNGSPGEPYSSTSQSNLIYGGTYGGGGGGSGTSFGGGPGGPGAVRIIWGGGRAFPATNTADQ